MTYAYFHGRQVSFGPAGPGSKRAYDDHVAQWLANLRANSDDGHCENTIDHCNWTVADISGLDLEHAKRKYDKRELQQFRQALRALSVMRGLCDVSGTQYTALAEIANGLTSPFAECAVIGPVMEAPGSFLTVS